MSDNGVRLPSWLVPILISLLATLCGMAFYAGGLARDIQQLQKDQADIERHLERHDTGIDQLWDRHMNEKSQ